MTQSTKAILKSGWGIYLGVVGVISLALDLLRPSVDLTNGRSLSLFKGSAFAGWIFVLVVMVSPALLLKEQGKTPLNKWLSGCWCFLLYVIWIALHTAEAASVPPRPNLAILGGLVLCWRLLTWGRNQTEAGQVPVKTFYFRRNPTAAIEGPGPLLSIRAFLMKNGGMRGVEYVENTGVPVSEISATAWRLLDQNSK
jgi:hypothetical protein